MNPARTFSLLLSCWAAGGAALASGERPNLMAIAHGSVPLRVEADAAARVGIEQALRAIDGAAAVYSLTSKVASSARVALIYALPAATAFDRFAVPNVIETPSPRQTFVRDVKVLGSSRSADDGFVLLASGTLQAQRSRGQAAELTVHRRDEVRWIRLELSGALDPAQSDGFLEFSEIVGEGRQAEVPVDTGFGGGWTGRGLALSLRQDGAVVDGCYDRSGRLQGTVSGAVLRASGSTADSGVRSAFIAVREGAGPATRLHVLRSTNGAPFHLFSGAAAPSPAACAVPPAATLGCGSVVHGIQFDFDSAVLREDSAPVLDALRKGLAADASRRIVIEGHTSGEGGTAYNQRLSEQRAAAVVEALVRLGLARSRLSASGLGETRPIAPNDSESGRVLNRRVEIHCSA